MKTISISDGETDTGDSAFCPDRMKEAGLDNFTACQALSQALGPFTGILRDGCGVGVYVSGETGTVIGFTAPKEGE